MELVYNVKQMRYLPYTYPKPSTRHLKAVKKEEERRCRDSVPGIPRDPLIRGPVPDPFTQAIQIFPSTSRDKREQPPR